MELKEKIALSQISTDMWACFSDAADYRKKLDGVYAKLLKMKNQLNGILDSKNHLDGNELRNLSTLVNHIENFYSIEYFPTFEDYEREASELDSLHERLEKQIEKEENK